MPEMELADLNFLTENVVNENKSQQSSTNNSCKALQSDDDSVNLALDTEKWTSSSIDEILSQQNSVDKVRELEEEHERLSNSILSLSSHFAQIQFRLQQITVASPEKRDELLKQLQELASKPCIDITEIKQDTKELKNIDDDNNDELNKKRKNVLNLIKELKSQTEELEKFAYEQGSGELPYNELKQRQKIVFDKLHEKIKLNIEIEKLTENELKKCIDDGIKQILEPIKEKEQLVDQLTTQIIDLENFVSLLQKESTLSSSTTSSSTTTIDNINDNKIYDSNIKSFESITNKNKFKRQNSLFTTFLNGKKFEKNELKNTLRGNHYGDERAKLEITIENVQNVLKKYSIVNLDLDDEKNILPDEKRQQEIFEWSEVEVVNVIRKEFCPVLRDLLQHGMRSEVLGDNHFYITNMVFGCFPDRSIKNNPNYINGKRQLQHIWDVIVYYYEDRRQKELNDGSIGKLSQTFNLESLYGKQVTSKEVRFCCF